MTDEPIFQRFKNDVAKFSGNYLEFLVVVKRPDGNITWKSSDTTWAIGACHRYIEMMDEMDRTQERERD